MTSPFDILRTGVCIKECPKEKDKVLKSGDNCLDPVAAPKAGQPSCALRKTYKTYDVFDYCIPASKDAVSPTEWKAYELAKAELKESSAGSFFTDLYNASTAIYVCMGLSLVWSLIFIYLLSWFAEQIAWCCVILIQLGLLGGSIVCFFMWRRRSSDVHKMEVQEKYSSMSKAE